MNLIVVVVVVGASVESRSRSGIGTVAVTIIASGSSLGLTLLLEILVLEHAAYLLHKLASGTVVLARGSVGSAVCVGVVGGGGVVSRVAVVGRGVSSLSTAAVRVVSAGSKRIGTLVASIASRLIATLRIPVSQPSEREEAKLTE